jgi:hypothetical protein
MLQSIGAIVFLVPVTMLAARRLPPQTPPARRSSCPLIGSPAGRQLTNRPPGTAPDATLA